MFALSTLIHLATVLQTTAFFPVLLALPILLRDYVLRAALRCLSTMEDV